MDQITIGLSDDLTLAALRVLAQGMGKRLAISFAGGNGAPAAGPKASKPGPARKVKRILSPGHRAALARNLAKARAVQAAKRAAGHAAAANGSRPRPAR